MTSPIQRAFALLALLSSLLLAAYGQLIISGADHWSDGWPLISTFDAKLTELYRGGGTIQGEQSVAAAIILFAVAMGLFVSAIRLSGHETSDMDTSSSAQSSDAQRGPIQVPLLLGGLVAVAGWGFLILRLAMNSYAGWYVALFFVLLAFTASLGFVLDRARGATFSFGTRFRIWELAFVMGSVSLFAGLVAQDLTNWRYASLGDDGSFFFFAKEIANGNDGLNLFSQAGPAGNHPLLSSAYQASIMNIAGVDILSWKLATLFVLVATIPIFYWLVRTLTNTRTAVFATAILASAHYLLSYAHTGYDNVFPLLPTVLALALFVGGTRRTSMLLLFCSGAVAGLGFYTFYSGRAAIVILALVVFFLGRKRWQPGLVLPLAIGFVLSVGPLFAVEGWNVIGEMQAESQAEGQSLFATFSGLAASAPRVFLAFNFNPYPKHFVSGSLLDDISAPLAMLGLAYAAIRVRTGEYRFLLIWFLVAIVVTGLFHPRQTEINSRLHYALLPMAAFAGIAIDRLVAVLGRLTPLPRAQPALATLCVVALLPAILGLNLYRHFEVSPERIPALSATLVLREARDASCDQPGLRTIVFAAQPFPLMPAVFEYYAIEDKTPMLFRYDDPPNVYESAIDAGNIGCVLLADRQLGGSGGASAYLAKLTNSALSVEEVSDASGRTTMLVIRLAVRAPP